MQPGGKAAFGDLALPVMILGPMVGMLTGAGIVAAFGIRSQVAMGALILGGMAVGFALGWGFADPLHRVSTRWPGRAGWIARILMAAIIAGVVILFVAYGRRRTPGWLDRHPGDWGGVLIVSAIVLLVLWSLYALSRHRA
jgi:hypothetical protein